MTVTCGCVLSQTIFGPAASPEALRTLTQQAKVLGFDVVRNFYINLPPVGGIGAQQEVMEQFVPEVMPLIPWK